MLGQPLGAQAAFVPQELTTVRVQDPRVQNEGSWNSYVDYKIFLHVSCGCCRGVGRGGVGCTARPCRAGGSGVELPGPVWWC